MIPRRRGIEEKSDGGSDHNDSQALSPLAVPNGTVASNANAQTSPSKTSKSSSSCNNNSSNSKGLLSQNKRMVFLMVFFLASVIYVNKQEIKVVLDESNYDDARKHYLKEQQGMPKSKYSTLDHYTRSKTQPSGKFVLKADTEFTPGIAWLMSFPNSGTSYTMTMVARSTNKAFATNYGNEVIHKDEENSISIYPRRPEGPYWPGMSGKQHEARDLPDKYVITKTHCGSRCARCGPDEYIETTEEFLLRCASGHGEFKPGAKRRKYDVTYPHDRVQRAIHLFRNPMHNLIARYHLEHRHKGYKNNTKWQDSHPNDAIGLHKWCEASRIKYEAEDIEFFGSKAQIPKVPCHGEFYKWTQWHNLAHESIELMRDGGPERGSRREIPVLKVFYENYNTDFDSTAHSILDFLELEQVNPFREFKSRSDYDGYFSKKELVSIKGLVKSIASDVIWEDVKHYFAGI